MDITISVPDRLAPALRAAAQANKDADAQAFCARAVREALAVQARQRMDEQQQATYQAARAAAQEQVQADLSAISAR